MDCKTAKRLLHLYKDGELTNREKTMLENHVSDCNSCRTYSNKLHVYIKAVKEITDQEPYLSDPVRLTNNIMSAIKPGESGLLQNATRLFRLTGTRVAASVLILIQAALFSYQQFYISGSVKKLSQVTQKQNTQTGVPGTAYQDCIEESRRIITEILGYDDPGFNRKAIKYSKSFSGDEIEDYAVQICQYSDRLQKTGNKQQKKQLLINILANDLNIKINPGI